MRCDFDQVDTSPGPLRNSLTCQTITTPSYDGRGLDEEALSDGAIKVT